MQPITCNERDADDQLYYLTENWGVWGHEGSRNSILYLLLNITKANMWPELHLVTGCPPPGLIAARKQCFPVTPKMGGFFLQ